MLELAMLATAIVTAFFSGVPLLQGLWQKIRAFFGSRCSSTNYLQNLDRSMFEGAMRSVLERNQRLRMQAERRYVGDGYGSDFSDF